MGKSEKLFIVTFYIRVENFRKTLYLKDRIKNKFYKNIIFYLKF